MDRWMDKERGLEELGRPSPLTSTRKTEEGRLLQSSPHVNLLSASGSFLGGTGGRGLREEKGIGRSLR